LKKAKMATITEHKTRATLNTESDHQYEIVYQDCVLTFKDDRKHKDRTCKWLQQDTWDSVVGNPRSLEWFKCLALITSPFGVMKNITSRDADGQVYTETLSHAFLSLSHYSSRPDRMTLFVDTDYTAYNGECKLFQDLPTLIEENWLHQTPGRKITPQDLTKDSNPKLSINSEPE